MEWLNLISISCFTNRVVNVSSRASHMAAQKCSDELKARFDDPNMMVPDAEKIMMDFVR